MKICKSCAAQNFAGAKFCSNCGQNDFENYTDDRSASRAVAPDRKLNPLSSASPAHRGLYNWAFVQLAIGFLGLGFTSLNLSMNQDSMSVSEITNEIGWQNNWSGIFNWGLGLLAISLAITAIRDYLITPSEKDAS